MFHYMTVMQITDDLYYISSIDTLVQMNEIVLEIVFHCNFAQHMFVWFWKLWGLMLCSVHLLSIEFNLYIKHLTQLVHFSVLCANMSHLKGVCLKTKAPICAQANPSRLPTDSTSTEGERQHLNSMWQKHRMCTAAYYP